MKQIKYLNIISNTTNYRILNNSVIDECKDDKKRRITLYARKICVVVTRL